MDRQCMEDKVDWMQSELSKIVRVMDSKSVLQTSAQGALPLRNASLPLLERPNAGVKCSAKTTSGPQPCLTCPLFPPVAVGAGLKKVNVGKREDITEIERDQLTFYRHLQDTERYDLYEGEYLKYPVAIKTFKRPLTTDTT